MFEQLSNTNPNLTPSPNTPVVENTSFARVPDPVGPVKKKSKALIIGLIVAFLILAGGGGALAYYYQTHAEEIITNKILARLDKVSSFKYNGTIETTINYKMPKINGLEDYFGLTGPTAVNQTEIKAAEKNVTSTVNINFQGQQDLASQKNNHQFSLDISARDLGSSSSGSSSPEFLSNFNLGLETRFLDKKIYAQLTNLPDLGFFDLSFLKNQWVSFDIASLEEQSKLLEEKMKLEKGSAKKITPEVRAQLLKLLMAKKAVSIGAKLPSEKIDNQKMFHYQLTLNQEGLANFYLEAYALISGKQPTDKDIAEFASSSKTMVETAENIQIWIGQDDYLPHQLSFNFKIKETNKSKFSGDVAVVLKVSEFNQPVVISVPEKTKSFQELINSLFNSFEASLPDYVVTNASTTPGFSGSSSSKINSDSDRDGLTDDDEFFIYKTSNQSADTDGDGYNDYQELISGFDPNGPGRLTDPGIITAANLLKLKATSTMPTSPPSTSITPTLMIPVN